MKNLFTLAITLAITTTITAQSFFNPFKDRKESFTISFIVDPVASVKENGLDVGAEIEYIGSAIYASGRIENFEALPGGYTSLGAAIGINFTNYRETLRLYTGFRSALVFRNGASNPIAGFEAGVDYYFDNGLFVGLRAAYDYRGDMKANNDPIIWRENGYIKIGYRWFWGK